jgi:hypothetical protein
MKAVESILGKRVEFGATFNLLNVHILQDLIPGKGKS